MPNNNISTALLGAVTKATEVLRSKVQEKLSSGYPKELRDGVSSKPPEQRGDMVVGTVEIEGVTVFAYEFGSGIWSERGPAKKYPIVPVNADFLAFNWPASLEAAAYDRYGKELVKPAPNGDVVLPRVMHPGIRSKPFAQPAVDESADEIAELIGDDFLVAFSQAIGPDVIVIS